MQKYSLFENFSCYRLLEKIGSLSCEGPKAMVNTLFASTANIANTFIAKIETMRNYIRNYKNLSKPGKLIAWKIFWINN